MSTDATPRKLRIPAPAGQISPPMHDAEARLRAIAEAQGVPLDGKAYEKLLGAGKCLWDSDEDFERFVALLHERRKQG